MNFSRFSGGRLFSTCALDGDMQEPRVRLAVVHGDAPRAHVAVPRDVSPRDVAGAPARFRLRVLPVRGLVHQRAEVVVHRQHRDDAPQQDLSRRDRPSGTRIRRVTVRGGRLGGRPRSDSGFALAEACVHRDWCPTPRRKIPTESTLTSVSL